MSIEERIKEVVRTKNFDEKGKQYEDAMEEYEIMKIKRKTTSRGYQLASIDEKLKFQYGYNIRH